MCDSRHLGTRAGGRCSFGGQVWRPREYHDAMGDRFLEDHRRPIADYDRIQFDEQEIAALRAKLELETPLQVRWNWDYVKEIESLRALYERGKTAQWNVETDIDWTLEMRPDEFAMPPEGLPITSILLQI